MFETQIQAICSDLERFSGQDLVIAGAALQLRPENVHIAFVPQAMVHVGIAMPRGRGMPVQHSDIQQIVRSKVFQEGPISYMQDPYTGMFPGAIAFYGGSYLVVPGVVEDDIYLTECVLQAVFNRRQESLSPDFRRASASVQAALVLSNYVLISAGLQRNGIAPAYDGKKVYVPPHRIMRELKSTVRIDRHRLMDLLRPHGLMPEDLAPLCVDPAQIRPDNYALNLSPLSFTPFYSDSTQLIIASPLTIVHAIRKMLIQLAAKTGESKILTESLHVTAERQAGRSLATYQDYIPIHLPLNLPPKLTISEKAFAIDDDKLAILVTITDELPSSDAVESDRQLTGYNEQELLDRLAKIIETIYTLKSPPNDLLVLLVVHFFAGDAFFSLDPGKLQGAAKMLAFTGANLQIISRVESGDSLLLYNFERVQEHVAKRQINLLAFDALSLFGCYRDKNQSFYLNDELCGPAQVQVDGSFASKIYCDDAQRCDRHSVISPDNTSVIPVILGHGPNYPIYIPELGHAGPYWHLVEGLPFPVWVISEVRTEAFAKVFMLLLDAASFWVCEATKKLNSLFERLQSPANLLDPVTIKFVDELSEHALDSQEVGEATEPRFRPTATVSERVISIAVADEFLRSFRGPTNAGERDMLAIILEDILAIVGVEATQKTKVAIEVMEAVAPLGLKKKLILWSGTATEANGDELPKFRKISESAEGIWLDRIGDHIRAKLKLQPGSVPVEIKQKLLREGVSFLYDSLCQLARSLDPGTVVEQLTWHLEAIRSRQQTTKTTSPTRIACFGQGAIELIEKETHDEVQTAIACGFLLELVAASPPTGIRPFCRSVYDEMVVLSSLIFDLGTQCDMLQHKLADFPLAVLNSGRIAFRSDDYQMAIEAYAKALSNRRLVYESGQFEKRWRPDLGANAGSGGEAGPAEFDEFDHAAIAEFGVTLSCLLGVLLSAAVLGVNERTAVVHRARDRFIREISELSGEREVDVEQSLKSLSLEPRNDFLHPAAPHENRDVVPWAFNRSLSINRRPFVIRGDTVIYGTRQVRLAAEYLNNLTVTGRLRSSSLPMKQLMSKIANETGSRFESTVAEKVRRCGLIARQGLKKIREGSHTIMPPGDIDVLAVDERRQTIWVLECKDLATARTPDEFSNQIKVLVRGTSNSKSTVEKHSARAKWVCDHLEAVKQLFSLPAKTKWLVKPAVVVDTESIAPFLEPNLPMTVITVEQLLGQIR